jgi:hypothetical protein
MSSGDKAKPPATVEERNPFDISRNSGPDVAAEIAKRMAAWKQARARTTPASTTSRSSTIPSATISAGDTKVPPPIAAPVQPARMPNAARGSQPAQTSSATGSAGSAASRVPYFAVSAIRRAMPPAPSLKQARPPAPESDERAARTDEPPIMPAEPVTEQSRQNRDEQPLQAPDMVPAMTAPEAPVAEASPAASATIEETDRMAVAPTRPEPFDTHPFQLSSTAEASETMPAEPDERERRRAEARAIKARWIAARDLDALLERPAAEAAQAIKAAEPASPDAGIVSAGGPGADEGLEAQAREAQAREAQGSEEDPVRSSTEEQLPDAASEPNTEFEATAQADEPASHATPPEEPEATKTIPTAARDEAAFGAAIVAASKTAPVADRDQRRESKALDVAALDEVAGRREPTFDTPRAAPETLDATPESRVEAPDAVIAPLRAEPVVDEAPDPTTAHRGAALGHALSVAELDAVAGRKEPTFDPPVESAASDGTLADETSEPQDEATSTPVARAAAEPAPVLSARDEAAEDLPPLTVDALDEIAGRKEPTFDEPVRPAVAAPAAAAAQKAPHIKLRPIETRIEARRVDTLRADPPMAARRPIFPHIEAEEWDMPPVIAARAERRGTGWAIGLGSLLLIAGITAPAAIWQQGRQVQDQVALVSPAPDPQHPPATPGSPATGATTAQEPAQAPTQATLPAAPQPEAPKSEATAPAVAAQQSSTPAAAEPQPETPETDAADAPPATTLSAIGNSDDVNEAPVVAPPRPMENLKTASTGTPMVARPFEPSQGDGPFLRAPTTGAATVPVTGAPVQSAAVGVKPNLIGLLKPKAATVASASKPVASRPRTGQRQPKPFFQQSPDQMFETLIETLSEGRPVNPATKPTSPSSRR